jgi:hypothetical protein
MYLFRIVFITIINIFANVFIPILNVFDTINVPIYYIFDHVLIRIYYIFDHVLIRMLNIFDHVLEMITDMFRLSSSQSVVSPRYHRVCNKGNTTGVICGAGTAYPSGVHELLVMFVLLNF